MRNGRRACQHGFAGLGAADGPAKTTIFARNSARLYRIDMRTAQGAITRDKVAAIKAEYVRQFVAYEQIDRGHALRVILDNPLPTRDGGRVGYSLAFDAFQRLIEGVATVTRNGDDISVEWNHSRPDWALGYRFTSHLRAIRASGYELTVTPTSR